MRTRTAKSAGATRLVRREVRRFDTMLRRSGDARVEKFGAQEAAVMRAQMLEEFRALVPQVPDIGGRSNAYTPYLIGAARGLATYRVVLHHGGTVEDAGELIHRRVRAELGRVPRVVRHWIGRHRFFGQTRKQWDKAARRSQARRYPADWVSHIVDADGQPIDFGMDTTECGIVKFLHAQGADELAPYICELDYLAAEMTGFQLRRTQTLAWGCDRCDHRITVRGDTTAPWPPRFVERTCGRPDAARPQPTPTP